MSRFDFVIVGSGMAGAGAAYELASRASVLLLERESAHGYHTTGRSAALYTEAYGNAVIRGLTRASRAFFEGAPGRVLQLSAADAARLPLPGPTGPG